MFYNEALNNILSQILIETHLKNKIGLLSSVSIKKGMKIFIQSNVV